MAPTVSEEANIKLRVV